MSVGDALKAPAQLLDREQILPMLRDAVRARVETLEVYRVTDSTSTRIKALAAPAPGRLQIVLAEYQTAGRGRHGRRWLSPFGAGLCLSVATAWHGPPAAAAPLGLALGVAVQAALATVGVPGIGLKWPNDILAGGRKLAGLLVESDADASGCLRLVAGVGLNLAVDAEVREALAGDGALPPVGLNELLARAPSRNRMAAMVINELADAFESFAASGFEPFMPRWQALDLLRDRPVELRMGARRLTGIARGIDADGALLLDRDGSIETIVAGELSVRPR